MYMFPVSGFGVLGSGFWGLGVLGFRFLGILFFQKKVCFFCLELGLWCVGFVGCLVCSVFGFSRVLFFLGEGSFGEF